MVSIFTEKLNSLMGLNRNVPLGEKVRKENYWDEDVCKFSLVTLCPHDLFPNTKFDLGVCEKRHDNFFKTQFVNDTSLRKLKLERQYLEDSLRVLRDRTRIVDEKVKKIQSKQDIALHKGEIPQEYQEKIDIVEQDIQAILRDMEKAGALGEIERYEELSEKLEQLRVSQKHLQLIAVNPTLAAKQMKLCEICGAMQAINDVEKRNLTHLDGKLHKGFETVRKELERATNRLETVLLTIEVKKEELRKKGKFVSDESEHEHAENSIDDRQRKIRRQNYGRNDYRGNNSFHNNRPHRGDNRRGHNKGNRLGHREYRPRDFRGTDRPYNSRNYNPDRSNFRSRQGYQRQEPQRDYYADRNHQRNSYTDRGEMRGRSEYSRDSSFQRNRHENRHPRESGRWEKNQDYNRTHRTRHYD